ncbi:MAG: response regulator [Pseudomonadota bacterium]
MQAASSSAALAGHDAGTATVPNLAGRSVLLVDDTSTSQIVVGQMLELLGARLRLVETGHSALAAAETDAFDLALVDDELPDMAGLDLIAQLRGSRADLRCMLMSTDAERGRAANLADGVVAKPIPGIVAFGAAIGAVIATDTQVGAGGSSAVGAAPNGFDEATLINTQVLDDLAAMIGADAMAGLLASACADFEAIEAALSDAADGPDLDTIRAQTHSLIGVAGALGAEPLVELARALNRAAKDDFAADGPELMQQTLAMIGPVRRLIARRGEVA